MSDCRHERTVQIAGLVYKCSRCGELVTDEDIPAPDWELISRRQRAREARISEAIRRNSLHRRER